MRRIKGRRIKKEVEGVGAEARRKKREEKRKYGGEEEGEKDKEKCEGGERGEGPRVRRAEMWEREPESVP